MRCSRCNKDFTYLDWGMCFTCFLRKDIDRLKNIDPRQLIYTNKRFTWENGFPFVELPAVTPRKKEAKPKTARKAKQTVKAEESKQRVVKFED